MNTTMEKFQIITYGNEILAKAIQEHLFTLGYTWESDWSQVIRHTNAGSIQVVELIGNGVMTFSRSRFLYGGGKIISLEELFTMRPEAKETVKIGTQTYDKADFEAATKHLTPIK